MVNRSCHPNPQFMRKNYRLLDGVWEFEIDNNFTGFKRDLFNKPLNSQIKVPYCPESSLSNIDHKDFIYSCWYKRKFKITEQELKNRVAITFGAVDYIALVFVNGKYVGRHEGGYSSFTLDITKALIAGDNELTVVVYDNFEQNLPKGKQSAKKHSYLTFYTRVTGIWQSVYLEFTPKNYLKGVKFFPNIENSSVAIETVIEGEGKLQIEIFYENRKVGEKKVNYFHKTTTTIKLAETHLWESLNGRLYDVVLTLNNEDVVYSYFGLREVRFEGQRFLLNNKSLFQRLVLIQGYNPEGIYTQTKTEMEKDIKKAIEFGFNGGRLHQKVFEPYFLYLCDKLGFMVWEEYPNWGTRHSDLDALGTISREWIEIMERDFNHPSIVTWCPLNEAWEDFPQWKKTRDIRFVEALYDLTKAIDDTRPCVDVSGGYHGRRTDLFDFHFYGNLADLKEHLKKLEEEDVITVDKLYAKNENIKYVSGKPIQLSEFGGISLNFDEEHDINKSWGYSNINNKEQFVNYVIDLIETILESSKLSGFCYTQLYDLEQEQNGLLTYERQHKLSKKDINRIKQAITKKAKIED